MKWWDRLKTSSKWQLGAGTIVFTLLQPQLLKVMEEGQFEKIWLGLLAILGGQTVADMGKNKAGS